MKNAEKLTELLWRSGYEAYLVGGCVRDMLGGDTPHDFDITTSASPDEMLALFSDCRVIETGIKHGTVTVLVYGEPYEITTFRSDGEYGDHRHPKSVAFSDRLSEDLSRRDFTVNALAYSKRTGLIDLFGGENDIKSGTLRAIGEPCKRFDEDALRILRALRFVSEKGFRIEENTEKAIFDSIPLLAFISAERIFSELKRLIAGKDVFYALTRYSAVVGSIVKPLLPCIGFKAREDDRQDLYTSIAKTVSLCPEGTALRLAALLCDVGKPFTDGNGCCGYGEKSAELAVEALNALRCDNKTKNTAIVLIKNLNFDIEPNKRSVLGAFNKIGREETGLLIDLKEAHDNATGCAKANGYYAELRRIATELTENNECFSVGGLAVNGNDVASLGIKQKRSIGTVLNALLDFVINGEIKNGKAELLEKAVEIIRKNGL